MSDKKNKIKDQIFDLIASSPNGIRINELQEKLQCHQNSIFYNINSLKTEQKIDGPIKKRYYPRDHPIIAKYNLDSIYFKNIPSDLLLTKRAVRSLFEGLTKRSVFKASQEDIDRFIRENNEKFLDIFDFETELLDTLTIAIKPKSLFLSDISYNLLQQNISNLLYDLLFSFEFLDNFKSLNSFPFELTISVGNKLETKITESVFTNAKKQLNNIPGLKQKTIHHFIERSKKQTLDRMDYIEIINKQIDKINFTPFKMDYYDCLKPYKWFFKYEDSTILSHNLTVLTNTFLTEQTELAKTTDLLTRFKTSKRANLYRSALVQRYIAKIRNRQRKKNKKED